MKIHLLSDLHHEFFRNSKVSEDSLWNMEIPKTDCDVIALVGDIDVGIRGVSWAIEQSEKLGVDICYTIGNHEHYSGNIDSVNRKIKEVTVGTNVHVLENGYVDINGYRFIGATLWTDMNIFNNRETAADIIQIGMNDYKKIRIKYNGKYKRLHPKDTCNFHNISLTYLAEQIESSPHPVIVLSHHAPSIQSVSQNYKSEIETASFASDLEKFILHYQPLAWLHGHTHTCVYYKIGNTIVAANQFGYLGIEECDDFIPDKIIEV